MKGIIPQTVSDSDDLKRAIDQIRVSEAVVLLGAGASYQAGMPLAGQLSPLVWHALDTHPDVLGRLVSILNVPHVNAKDVVGDNADRIRIAFAQIAADPPTRRTFQLAFTNLNRDKSQAMSRVHDALAKLVYTKHVLRVVSLTGTRCSSRPLHDATERTSMHKDASCSNARRLRESRYRLGSTT